MFDFRAVSAMLSRRDRNTARDAREGKSFMGGGTPVDKRLSRARARLDELRRQDDRATDGLLADALEELGKVLEELHLAYQEVEAQNHVLSATEKLEQERQWYADLFELAPEGYLVTDPEGVIQEANQAALAMLGLRSRTSRGLPIAVLFDTRGRRQLYGVLDLAAHGEVVRGWQITLAPRQGAPVVASIHCAPKLDAQGRVTSLRWLIHDIGALVEARHREAAALEQARRRLAELTILQEATHEVAGVLETSRVLRAIARHAARIRGEMAAQAGVVKVSAHSVRVLAHHDPSGQIDYTDRSIPLPENEGLLTSLGSTRAWPWRTAELLPDELRHLASELNLVHGAVTAIPRSGDEVHVLVIGSPDPRPFSAEDLTILEGLAGIASIALRSADTYQREAWLASTDPLTGLPNRRHFERLAAVPHERGLAVLAIDVDNLKALNDTYGHDAGDVALAAVANCLKSCLREGDVVARTGGDEFSAILYAADQADAEMVAARMREIMHHVTLPQGEVRVSVGVAVAPTAGDVSAARAAADEALYAAKAAGRDRVVIRSRMSALFGRRRRESAWEETLAEVLDGRGLFAVYQPIVRLRDRSVVAYEGLVRPEGTAAGTPVDGLFDAARTMGLHRDLDWLARRTVIEGAEELPQGIPIFMKVTLAMLLDRLHDVDQMQLLLAWVGRLPQDVVLEISARESVRDPGRLEAVLAAYRAEGFRFAVDHVGAEEGHQGIDGLTRVLPEFVRLSGRLLRKPRHNPALPAAVAFARAMGATVIAGWVEKESEVRAVAQLDVQLVQGYLTGRPSRGFDGEPMSWLTGRVEGRGSALAGRRAASEPADSG